ncbi:MAG: FAD-dependent oxidoreductase [Clostridiales bacterium]|jgi:NADPH-dependent 2,4-dienoyl-CoA reductase/sulfur reductase-like enzyme|nr:FAD-dependent oxidoreductase [Clostridiales bacterium]
MKTIRTDIAIIGGGPAGLAAALEARRAGFQATLIERDAELGGILRQCIHDGFGIHRFKKRLSGNQYAQAFIDRIALEGGINALLGTMALEVSPDKKIYACGKESGMIEIISGAVILCMGCRERTAHQALICGDRPAGVLTAGSVQRYINIEGYLPGKTAVILGSGDIGLIMARRMALEGIEVKGVYEAMPNPGGLSRNLVQCLDDFGIPLHLSKTVSCVHGRNRVSAVTVADVDASKNPIAGTEEIIPCDLLVLAVGLIPENELSLKAGVELDPKTKGSVLNGDFMTSIPGIFAAGNVAAVFDLVDYVSLSGEMAARGAAKYLRGELRPNGYEPVKTIGNISFIVPQRLSKEATSCKQTFFLRVKEPQKTAKLRFTQDNKTLYSKRIENPSPPEMIYVEVEAGGESPIFAEIS